MAVTDIRIVDEREKPPQGWLKDGHDLNSGAGGSYLYLLWERDGQAGPVTDLAVVENDQTPGPGFTRIDRDLNENTDKHGARLYLCYSRTAPRKPVLDLAVVLSNDQYAPAPAGFTRYGTDLNKGAGGEFVFLCYRRQE